MLRRVAVAGVVVIGLICAAHAGYKLFPCVACDGTGLSKQVCPLCNGIGHKNGQRCWQCKGYGYPPCIACGGDGQVRP